MSLVSIDSMGIVPRLPFSETERGFYGHIRSFDTAISGIRRFSLHRQSKQPKIDRKKLSSTRNRG